LDDELVGLRRLRRPDTQRQDPLTREYIAAGLDLIQEALNYDPTESSDGHPFLAWISQRRVVEVANTGGRIGGRATLASLRDRWEPHGNYLWDLVDHVRARRPSRSLPVRARDLIQGLLMANESAPAVVRRVGRKLMEGVFENPFFRLQLLALAVVGSAKFRGSPEAGEIAGFYDEIDERWDAIVQGFLAKYSLEPRVGVKERDLIQLGAALADGIALRELADPTRAAEREERLRLHSTGLLALLLSLTVPSGSPSVSIDKAVTAMVERRVSLS
jgi:hypothetical protein